MTIEARRVYRGVSGALLTLTLVLLATVSVARADTIYPDNKLTGTSFDNGSADGWSSSTSCTLLAELIPIDIPNVLCEVKNTTNSTEGAGTPDAPPGSIQSQFQSVANGLAVLPPLTLFTGNGTFRSPSFTIPSAGGGQATLLWDRRALLNAVLALFDEGTYTWYLVNDGGGESALATETLNASTLINDLDTGYETLAAPSVAVTGGDTYHLEVRSTFRSVVVTAALHTFTFQFDNVRLRVNDNTDTFESAPKAVTTPATNVTETTATLNGITNAKGLPSTYTFTYGTAADLAGGTTIGPFDAGTKTDDQDRSRNVSGLVKCTTYFFRISASNTDVNIPGTGTTNGNILSFRTNCEPTVVTDPVTGNSMDAATFNSTINPNGSATTYHYEYRVKGTVPWTSTADGPTIPAGTTPVAPNSVPVGGLTKSTTYEVRAVASNATGGPINGNIVEFTTAGDGATGATGASGATGATGTQGATGPQGPAGQNGTNGTNGTNGAPGAQGPPGPPGAPGARGPAGTTGSSTVDLDSSSARAMIRIDATTLNVPSSGRNIGRVRVRIFCRSVAVRTCSGNMKVRSLNPIRPHSFGLPARAKRRVTWATDAVQLDVRKIGFGILNFNAQRRSVLRREKRVRSTVIVTVIDANNNRQNVRKVVTVVRGK